MRIALAGSVTSSRRTLAGLVRHRANITGVLGLAESESRNVSGYARLDDLAAEAGAPYSDFAKLNAPEIVAKLEEWKPDVLFVVGISQLAGDAVTRTASRGCVGFHPTLLPKGRGRAPLAWIILDGVPAAATYFELTAEPDAGGILAQEPVDVGPDDYASDVVQKLEEAADRALDRWLPSLLAGRWEPVPQDGSAATFYGVRRPDDGLIRWSDTAESIHRLIRAAADPHPGAFTFFRGRRVVVQRAAIDRTPVRGVAGRVVGFEGARPLVQTGAGILRLDDYAFADEPSARPDLRAGALLGIIPDLEWEKLSSRIAALEQLAGSRRPE